MPVRIVQCRIADGTALTNTTTETVLDYVTIPAGSLVPGKIYRCRGKVRATATNSTDTLTVKLYGHTTSAVASGTALGTSGAVDVADNDIVVWDIDLVPAGTQGVPSSSGVIQVSGLVSAAGAEGTVTARGAHEKLSSINCQADYYVGVTGKWSVASASNSCLIESFTVEEIS